MRWDPQPDPVGEHPGYGVSYAACDLATAVAEVFQQTRVVAPSPDRHLTSWSPVRPLRLLDLTRSWGLRNEAAAALTSAPKSTCGTWATAIHDDIADLDGLWTLSTLTGEHSVVLFEPAADSFPVSPAFTAPLDAGPVWQTLHDTAAAIRYAFRSP